MGRPSIGPTPRTKVISVRVTAAELAIITAGGVPPAGFLRQLLDRALRDRDPPPQPAQEAVPAGDDEKPDARPLHRHRREKTGPHWEGGVDIGTWKCSTCEAPLPAR